MKHSDLVDKILGRVPLSEEEANVFRKILNDPHGLLAISEGCDIPLGLLVSIDDPLYAECREIAKKESLGGDKDHGGD